MVVRFVFVLIETNIVENKEFRLGTEEGGIRQSGQLHVVFCFPGNIARIFGIIFPRDRILNITGHHQSLSHERINEGS